MITPPNNWNTLWANQNSTLEVRLVLATGVNYSVNLATFTNENLASCTLEASLFNGVSIGNVCSARLRFVLKDMSASFGVFEENQRVTFTCRLRSGNTYSGYANQGVYYIQQFTLQENGDIEIIAYDELYKMQDYVSQQTGNLSVNSYLSRMSSMYGIACSTLFFTSTALYDTTNIMSTSGSTQISGMLIKSTAADIGFRKVLQTIAALAGGNVAINKSNRMWFYRLDEGASITSEPLGTIVTVSSLYKDDRPTVITGIDLETDGTTYPSSSGWRIHGQSTNKVSADGSRELAATAYRNFMADKLNVRVSNVRCDGAFITPLIELGDIVSVDLGDGTYYNFMLTDYALNYSGGCWGYIGCPATKDNFAFSLASVWNSTDGWIGTWTQNVTSYLHPTNDVEIPDKYRIVFPILWSGNVSGGLYYNVAYVSIINTISGTITYDSNGVDGTSGRKTATVTGYLSASYYPVERTMNDSNRYNLSIRNLTFYSTDIPDNAVGANIITHSFNQTYKINQGH